LQYEGRAKKMSIFEKTASGIRELYSEKIINNFRHRQRIKKGISASKSREINLSKERNIDITE
jgi:hypothetical protein